MRGQRRGDTGAGTVVALALILAVILAAVAVATLAEAVVVRHRAAAAADAAALAGATAAAAGDDGCAGARQVAARVGAHLTRCRAAGGVVDVAVEVAPPPWLAWAGSARVRARAGPAYT